MVCNHTWIWEYAKSSAQLEDNAGKKEEFLLSRLVILELGKLRQKNQEFKASLLLLFFLFPSVMWMGPIHTEQNIWLSLPIEMLLSSRNTLNLQIQNKA